MNSFYTEEELKKLGLKSVGQNVSISKKASIYGSESISIGDNVRIDDFCILSGTVTIGSYVHIAAYSSIFSGEAGVILDDFVNVSSRVAIYGKSDDYSGESATSPLISEEYENIQDERVKLEKYSLIGTGTTILPGVVIKEGAAVGAMSLVNKDLSSYSINAGIPASKIKERSKKMVEKYKEFLKQKK